MKYYCTVLFRVFGNSHSDQRPGSAVVLRPGSTTKGTVVLRPGSTTILLYCVISSICQATKGPARPSYYVPARLVKVRSIRIMSRLD